MDNKEERRASALPVSKVRPAYQQIADQIRGLIIAGTLNPGEQLPSDEQLSGEFGVSRNTTREALRMLSSQGLVQTLRGVLGGTFVARPDAQVLQDHFETGLGLMSGSNQLTAQELYETRLVLEVPAAEWAAERRTEEDLVRIRHAHRHVEAGKVVVERADFSADFHQAVMHAAHNRLMSMIAPPVWRVFTRCAVERGGVRHIWRHIDHDHEMILQHIERHEPTEAAEAMRMHLERLREHNL